MKKNINNCNYQYSDKTKQFFIKLGIIAALSGVLSCKDIPSLKEQKEENNKELYIGEEDIVEWHKQVEIAKKEIVENGIPEFQKAGYVKDKSEKAFNNITPQSYGDLALNMKRYYRFKKNLGRDKDDLLRWGKGEKLKNGNINKKNIYYKIPKRDDAFLLYLGMPQKNNSFGISDYQPQKSKDKNKVYFKLNYTSKEMKQKLLDRYFEEKQIRKNINQDTIKIIMNERLSIFEPMLDSLRDNGISNDNPKIAERVIDNPLGDFKVSTGKDNKGEFISIYDIRDLTPFKTGDGSSANKKEASSSLIEKLKEKGYNVNEDTEISSLFGAGKPFEIYDRIYYNPITKKIIE